MPGPVYSKGGRASSIDLLRAISNAFKLSLSTKKSSATEKGRPQNSHTTSKTYILLLLKKLGDQDSSYEERAKCAVEVRQLLDTLDEESIPALWYSAHDLIDNSVPQPTKKAALELLYECIVRCEEESLRIIFFHFILDHIISLAEQENPFEKDSEVTLFLSCLNLTVEKCGTLLGPEEFSKLAVLASDLVLLALQLDANSLAPKQLLQLIELLCKFIEPVKENILLGVTELVNAALQTDESVEHSFLSGVIDFLSYLIATDIENISVKLFHELASAVVNVTGKLNKGKDDDLRDGLKLIFQDISNSSQNESFLNQLFMSEGSKFKEENSITEVYALELLKNLRCSLTCENSIGIQRETISLVNKLFDKMEDKILLEVIIEILNPNFYLAVKRANYDFWLCERTNELGLWPLIKLTLTRNHRLKGHFGPKIMDFILRDYDESIPISVSELLLFIHRENIAIQIESMVRAVEMESRGTVQCSSLQILVDKVLVPAVDVAMRLRLWKLFMELSRQNLSCFASQDTDKCTLLSMIYHKGEALDMSREEADVFGNLWYAIFQGLNINELRILVKDHIFTDVYQILGTVRRKKKIVGAIGNFTRGRHTSEYSLRKLGTLVHCLIKSFIWSATDDSGYKCILLYQVLVQIYERAANCGHTDTLLDIARSMIRIRCDTLGHLYLENPSDAVGISSAFGRNKNSLSNPLGPFKWTYPETIGIIDESLLRKHNIHVRFSHSNENSEGSINIGTWLSAAISSIESPGDLEIYSYLLTHLCGQLSDILLFKPHHSLIAQFKRVICEHLTKAIPSNILEGDKIGVSDLHSAYVRNLSAVLAYHPYQPKSFADELINALVGGLISWEKTLIPILHILTVSCFEIPQSIQRYLTPILQHIQKRITSLYAIPSILEFLLALCDSPKLISNLTIDEIKRVFAIIFKIAENSVDLRMRSKIDKQGEENEIVKSPTYQLLEYEVDLSPSTESFLIRESLAEFFQHESFRVLACWFVRLTNSCKLELMPFIQKNLNNLKTIECVKYDAIAYMDFFRRSRFGPQNSGIIVQDGPIDSENDRTSTISRWIHGNGLISIQTETSSQKATVMIRKPSCNLTFDVARSTIMASQPTYNIFEQFHNEESNHLGKTQNCQDLEHEHERILFQILYTVEIPAEDETLFIKIPDNIAFRRSIGAFDRIPNVEYQKTGIIYIGPSQNTEEEVLYNTEGSYQYHWFLCQMGEFIKLAEIPKFIYTGGLDCTTDGEYALVWRDEMARIAFHTVTLMPNDSDTIAMKKQHVGNDLVNIFYDESNLPEFNFNIIKSQFTFISIVITPQISGYKVKDEVAEHYKVKVYRRSGTPGLLSCTHFKIIRRQNLARYVRHVCLIANALAQKYYANHSSDTCSIWGVRCKHLATLRGRAAALKAS